MFHASEENRLYNFTNGTQTDVGLKQGRDKIDPQAFLDDVSHWMEDHGDIIKHKYLPFSCLAVGLVPSNVSAFVYGCFVGRALEKSKIKVETNVCEIDREEIARQIKEDINGQMGWLRKILGEIDKMEKEKDTDNDKV